MNENTTFQAGEAGETIPVNIPSASENDTQTVESQLQSEVEKYKDLALRSQADFDNFRKRSAREREDAVKYANASFLDRLLPILDNFELGIAAARSSSEGSAIVQGMEMVGRQLADFLTQVGVEPIETEGAVFDPNLHEAVGYEAHPEIADGQIIRQHRKGFKLRDRLLRPSVVVVSKGQ